VSFSWNATTNGLPITVTISINGGGKQGVGASGSTTVGDGYSQNWSIVVESCDSTGSCKQASASATTDAPPAPRVEISQGAARTGGWYIRFRVFNGRANANIGCQFTTSDGAVQGQWQRNVQLDSSGNGSSESQEGTGTTWIWGFRGTISGNCDGIGFSQAF